MPSAAPENHRPVAYWLFACAALIFCIVVVGGVTRLTRSGLSIVEWKPISGILPPIAAADWEDAFGKYRETPEYKLVNRGMSLSEFKNIFWWEYIHRVLARLVGAVFLVPFLWFLMKRNIRGALAGKLAVIFALGAAQGFLGWYMVKSGLVKDPHVSHLRLMSHLMLAVILYGILISTAWNLVDQKTERSSKAGWLTVALTFLLLASGALVAGLKAGKMFNTFPLMNGSYFPPGMLGLEPGYTNFYDNPVTVQFIHRNLAYLLGGLLLFRVFQGWSDIRAKNFRHPLVLLFCVYLMQVLLGVLTLLNSVPVSLGALHQANALLLFSAALYARTKGLRFNGDIESGYPRTHGHQSDNL